MNQKLSPQNIEDIRSMRKVGMEVSRIADIYKVSERTINRVCKSEKDTYACDYIEDGQNDISSKEIMMFLIAQLKAVKEARDKYRAKSIQFPSNCAWGNLELKYDQEYNRLLLALGKYKGIDSKDNDSDNMPIVFINDIPNPFMDHKGKQIEEDQDNSEFQ